MSAQDHVEPEPRRPHTFYLTSALWNELERRYLEERLAGRSLSKIAFLEHVLRSGLDNARSDRGTEPTATTSSRTRRQPATGQRSASGDSKETPPSADPDEPRLSADVAASGTMDAPDTPRSPARSGSRSSALSRLREASDPGRPPPIESAAPLLGPGDRPGPQGTTD